MSRDSDRTVLDNLPIQIWVASADGALVFVNRYTAEYFGVACDTLIGQGWQSGVHPSDLPETLERWQKALATGQPYETEFRLQARAGGQYRWHSGRAFPVRDTAGYIVQWTGTNVDIDADKRASEVREASREMVVQERERLRLILEQAPVALCVFVGPQLRLEQSNESWRQVTGLRLVEGVEAQQGLATAALEHTGPHDCGPAELLPALQEAFASGTSRHLTWERIQGECAVRFICQPLVEKDENVYGVLVVARPSS